MAPFYHASRRPPLGATGSVFCVTALGAGAISLARCPLTRTLSQVLSASRIRLASEHDVLLAASGVGASVAILLVSQSIGATRLDPTVPRMRLLLDLATLFIAAAWLATLAMLCCFIMLIGSA